VRHAYIIFDIIAVCISERQSLERTELHPRITTSAKEAIMSARLLAGLLAVAVPSLLLAAKPQPQTVLRHVHSGPEAGTELPIFKAKRATRNMCVHCAMTCGYGVISFVKELDPESTRFIRSLDESYLQLAGTHRARLLVVWLDGDPRQLKDWAEQQGIARLQLGVVASDNAQLQGWALNPTSPCTVVLLEGKVARASYGDVIPVDAVEIGRRMETHFAK
jgi:hypothetical protein